MKPFDIFRPGRHTASNGTTLDFTEAQLRDAVAAYDPKLHEAPITVGHPKDNLPAYGWIQGLSFDEGTGAIQAQPQQVDAEFSDMVGAGRFKKRSASWYLPDAPNNPTPGKLYLRHVAFLGAQPPAVKGLRDVSFAEEEGVIEFSSAERFAWGSLTSIMRGLREWIIGKDGQEAADKLVPNWMISDLDAASKAEADPVSATPAAMPAFSEGDPMKIEELQAQVAALTAERDQLKTQQAADFAERDTALAAREAAVAASEAKIARAGVEARVDAAVKAGRALPKDKARLVDFAMGLADADKTIDFGEGDKAEKITQREAYLRQVEAAPKVVDYREASSGTDTPPSDANDPQAIADKAREIVAEHAAKGKAISFTEAVAQVTAESAT